AFRTLVPVFPSDRFCSFQYVEKPSCFLTTEYISARLTDDLSVPQVVLDQTETQEIVKRYSHCNPKLK
ncbi:hypothetical protein MMJ09_24565, partial [Bacillus vallismortis]|nr:hypothetical protein [Bacillus vallismortis]